MKHLYKLILYLCVCAVIYGMFAVANKNWDIMNWNLISRVLCGVAICIYLFENIDDITDRI